MRRNLLVAVLVGTGLTISMWGVSAAQNQGSRAAAPASGETRIALVDVAYIFKKYDKFTRLYDQMKAEVKQRETDIANAQAELKNLMNQKQQFTPDSPNYKQIEQTIVTKKGQLELNAESARREFTQKEANLYHQTYQEVEAMITSYAERNRITLVLRALRDSEGANSNPQEVIKEVSQMVIYSLPNMDITDDILTALNSQPASKSSIPTVGPSTKPATGSQPTTGGPKNSETKTTQKPGSGSIKK